MYTRSIPLVVPTVKCKCLKLTTEGLSWQGQVYINVKLEEAFTDDFLEELVATYGVKAVVEWVTEKEYNPIEHGDTHENLHD